MCSGRKFRGVLLDTVHARHSHQPPLCRLNQNRSLINTAQENLTGTTNDADANSHMPFSWIPRKAFAAIARQRGVAEDPDRSCRPDDIVDRLPLPVGLVLTSFREA